MDPQFRIRAATRLDVPAIRDVENKCFADCIELEQWRLILSSPESFVIVCELGKQIFGYTFLQKLDNKSSMELFGIAVMPVMQLQGIGRRLLECAKREVRGSTRHKRIVHDIPEENLGGQLFLKACGFLCKRIIRTDEDGDFYRFIWEPA